MAKKYTRKEIIDMCDEASNNMESFYQANFVKFSGTVKGEKVYYTEIIAEWLLNHFKELENIKEIEREGDYNLHHDGVIPRITNRTEEIRAKELFNSKTVYPGIGKIIDYQTPLKDRQTDNAGKIDLLSRNDKEKRVYILELKKKGSDETMLRCVLEAYTYLRTVSKERLFKSFGIPEDYELKAAPLVYPNSVPYSEYKDVNRESLHELMRKLNIEPFFIEEVRTFKVSVS